LSRPRYAAAFGAILLALLVPTAALAVATPPRSTGDQAATFETPAKPTPRPAKPQRTARPTKAPSKTAKPEPTAVPASLLPPARSALTIGYQDDGVLGQAPLQLALAAGYFDEVGLTDVVLVAAPQDAVDDVLAGDLDIAVVGAMQAEAANVAEPGLRAIAGYQNYQGEAGAYGGDLLLATPGLVADEPSTIGAFLDAYIRALQDLSAADTANAALATLQAGGVAIDPDVAARWPELVAAYAPFDGGFGDPSIDGGLGELDEFLTVDQDNPADLDALIAQAPLNLAQSQLDILSNPESPFMSAPTPEISIALPMQDGLVSPIVAAQDAGYFGDAGFTSVEIVDIEQPLLGVLTGEVDFGVVSLVDAADGITQGLPIQAIAGHQNYALDGSYGGDVVIATSDLISNEPAAVAAFLTAYVRALQEDASADDGAPFAPFDGGFGMRASGAGLAELSTYVQEALGSAVDLDALIAVPPLEYVQTSLGLPANPASRPAPTAADSEEEGA
jgi:ABC-type nitrate/sulfonate/bicarbonate transport system substrate-binding protein